MKKLAMTLILGLVLFAQSNLSAAIWMFDLPKAQAKAKEENKLVLLDFTGSDWCPPCMALHKNVFSNREFERFAKENLILVKVDFPRQKVLTKAQKAHNEQLAKRFKVTSYPTCIVLDSEGNQLRKTVGYGGAAAKEFVEGIAKLRKPKS